MSCRWSPKQIERLAAIKTMVAPADVRAMACSALTGILANEAIGVFGQAPMELPRLAYEYVEGMLLADVEFWEGDETPPVASGNTVRGWVAR